MYLCFKWSDISSLLNIRTCLCVTLDISFGRVALLNVK